MADTKGHPGGSRWTGSDKLAIALFCLGLVVAIVLFWVNRTPIGAGISIAAIVLLVIYPIVHFIRSRTGREIAIPVVILLAAGFGWIIWPKQVAPSLSKTPPVVEQTASVQQTSPPPAPHSTHKSVIKPLAVKPVNQAPVPLPTASAPNGIAITGGTVTNPTVNNYTPPEAKISVASACSTVEPYQCEITFTTDAELTSNIAFTLKFDQTVEQDYKVTTSVGPAGLVTGFGTGIDSPNPNNMFKFSIVMMPPTIPKGGQIYVTLHSKQPVHFLGAQRGF